MDWLTQSTGVELEAPAVLAALTNNQGIVTAGLSAHAKVVSILQTNETGGFVVPSIEDVSLLAVADLQGIRLTRVTASSLGQPVSATANYDISATGWRDWLTALREPDWNRLSGKLSVRQAEIAALAKFAPGLVAPVGTMELELELNPNLQGRGSLRVSNAVTRPLNPVGALRDVQADIALEGWDATIRDLRATLLGRRVSLSGTVGWSPDGLRHMNVRVSGVNLSLVHEPDMFIRADVNLHLLKAAEGTGRLSGEVKLRRSLLVRDFESFIELDRAEPEQRPPWFSITAEPFDSWGIDVRVNGDRFLNVITPAFKGEVSAGLQLLGTLGEPFLVGAVTVDSGKLLFPFGQVALERGRVDFSRQDPYRPQLDFRGEGLNFGYSITADLTGPMDSPNLTLQSVPPLTAQEILLMLSAGEIPRSDFGYTSSDKASRIGYFVGKEFVNRFIGNTAATERLVLRSGEYVTEDGGTTHMLEYKITGRLSVFGEYDRFQDFNSGLKVKVLSK
jgi:translocation and assembly module TamB